MFEFYNPHPQQKIVEDCVKRALTKASGKTYQEVTNELNRIKRDQGASKYNVNSVWKAYVEDVLHGKKMSFPAVKGQSRMNGARFCLEYAVGTYVLNMAGHLSCCVNGVIYDTWDCREKCVYTAYEIPAAEPIKLVVNGLYHADDVDIEPFHQEEEEVAPVACEAMNDVDNRQVAKASGEVIHYSGKMIIEQVAKLTKTEVQITKKNEPWISLNPIQFADVLNALLHDKKYAHLRWKTRRGSKKSTIIDERTGMTLILKNGEGAYLWCTKN